MLFFGVLSHFNERYVLKKAQTVAQKVAKTLEYGL